MVAVSGFIIFSLIITLGYMVGLLMFLTEHNENQCEMTFMFQYPQFVRIHQDADFHFKRYNLYAYSEGRFIQRVRDMQFDGIPVLFVPGNAGSFKQVRSFASVALSKSLDSRPGFHFDFFSVDLNDELSGLNGALLKDQMHYVNQSMIRILELYKNNRSPPKSIVIIAHSMGGIIAKGLLAKVDKNAIPMSVIITLATPHLRPPLALDHFMTDFYAEIERDMNISKNTSIIALSGGFNDHLVAPFLTYTKDINKCIATTSVPLVWLPIDHLCILWCKQLVLVVVRGLFDLVDSHTKQISLDRDYQQTVFQHHLAKHSGTKMYKMQQHEKAVAFNKYYSKWVENFQKQYTILLPNGTKQTEWHMIRLFDDLDQKHITILALNLNVAEWIFACSALHPHGQYRICSEGFHLAQLSEIAPSIKYKRRILHLDLHELKKNHSELTHIVIRVPSTSEAVTLHVDRYNKNERKIEVNLPRWWTFGWQSIISETPAKILYYELMLPQLHHIIQSYKLFVEPVECIHDKHHAAVTLSVPWANYELHTYITKTERKSLYVELYNSRPSGFTDSYATIRLTLDPSCKYSVSIRNSLCGMLTQIARTYSPLLIANIVAVVLLSFRNQLISIGETGSCSLFTTALQHGVKPYYIITMVKLVSRILSWKGFSYILPPSDWQTITNEGNDFFLLLLLLYTCSVGIVWSAALGITASLFLCESTITRIATKILTRALIGAAQVSNWFIGGFHKLSCFVACSLVALTATTCGGLTICLGCGFYFLKLTQMSQDYVENLTIGIVNCVAKKFKRTRTESVQETEMKLFEHSSISFHFSVFILWLIMAILSVPSVLTWARNFKYSPTLLHDQYFFPGILLSICAIALWQMDLPKPNIYGYNLLSQILNVLAAACLIYTPISIYRLNYILTGTIVLITLHQCCMPSTADPDIVVEDTTAQLNVETSYSRLKQKWE